MREINVKKSLLQNRKRTSELSTDVEQIGLEKKDELMALKLKALNEVAEASGKLFELPLSLVRPDPSQPRKNFINLENLAASIKAQGILQPIIVKPRNQAGQYQVIVGERRFHAAKMAELKVIPCIIREEEDANTLILQLLENDQREQVPPLEEAEALQRLIKEMGLSKKQIAAELGRDATWISMRLGLLESSPTLKNLLQSGKVTDLRTLHELRQLERENPEAAETALLRLQTQNFNGNFRSLIQSLRNKNQLGPTMIAPYIRIKHEELRGNEWWFQLEGQRKPLKLLLDKTLAKALKKRLDEFLRNE